MPAGGTMAVISLGEMPVGAEDVVEHSAVRVEDDAYRVSKGRGRDIEGLGEALASGNDVLAAYIFVGDGGALRTLVNEIGDLAGGPVNGLANDAGIEVRGSRPVPGAAGDEKRGTKKQGQAEQNRPLRRLKTHHAKGSHGRRRSIHESLLR